MVTNRIAHKWGMVVDLDRCTGCQACVVACQSENNLPINVKEYFVQQRAYEWIRVERYWEGEYPNVKIFWGDEDAGQTLEVDQFSNTKWDNEIDFDIRGIGQFSADVTGLTQPKHYYFRAYAVSSGGEAWSPLAKLFAAKVGPYKRD